MVRSPLLGFAFVWCGVRDLLRHSGGGRRTVILADASGQLGSVTSESLGLVDPVAEDLPGECLHALRLEHGLIAPGTFVA